MSKARKQSIGRMTRREFLKRILRVQKINSKLRKNASADNEE
jgi:hypothetical protein